MNRITDRERLHRRLSDVKPGPPLREHLFRLRFGRQIDEKIVSAVEHVIDPSQTRCTMPTAMTPLRAPMPAKSNVFSMWSLNLFEVDHLALG